MELQEFIKNTLVQITNGVIDAQNELKDTGCLINPVGHITGEKNMDYGQIGSRNVQKIKMNVVLEVSESAGSQKGMGIGIGVAKVFNAGVNTDKAISNSQATSVEFEIPIAFPVSFEN